MSVSSLFLRICGLSIFIDNAILFSILYKITRMLIVKSYKTYTYHKIAVDERFFAVYNGDIKEM